MQRRYRRRWWSLDDGAASVLVLAIVTVTLLLVGFLVVVTGPRPGRGSRWFWFWLLGLPLGLGVLALAVFELLRPPRLVALPVATTDDAPTASDQYFTPKRLSGWAGLWITIIGAILVKPATQRSTKIDYERLEIIPRK